MNHGGKRKTPFDTRMVSLDDVYSTCDHEQFGQIIARLRSGDIKAESYRYDIQNDSVLNGKEKELISHEDWMSYELCVPVDQNPVNHIYLINEDVGIIRARISIDKTGLNRYLTLTGQGGGGNRRR